MDKKGKKGSTDNKKENSGNNKLKKYNSMENLKSASKLEEENAQSENGRESAVVLRHKQQMKKAAEMKENNKQQQHQKRGERRSWGTEELTYLGDANSIAKEANSRDNEAKDIRKAKDHQKANKKKDEQSEPLVSSESILTLNETAEFHVVTKKKKPKKKPEEMRPKPLYPQQSHMQGGKYPTTKSYSTDRDPYLTPLNLKFKRRKSTSSSMPPSEKSDSSDVDSVHSLPIESSSRSNNNVPPPPIPTGNNTPPASYAEIARISQQNKQSVLATSLDKWPTVSSGKNPESPDNSNMSTCSTLSAKSQSSLRGNKFFPESNDMSNAIHDPVSSNISSNVPSSATKSISYSQSLSEDKQQKLFDISSANEEVIKRSSNSLSVATNIVDVVAKTSSDTNQKNPLQKSKSVDNDNYVNMNIDQYPALEKTVKPQKQYQSMPAVQTNNVNANQVNVAISSTKQTSKSTKLSSQSQSTPVVKSIDSSTTHQAKKAKLPSTNIGHQPASKEKSQLEAAQEFVFNQVDDNLKTKPAVDMCDVSFCTMLPPLHSSSTTKKSVKREKSSHQTVTQNHLNFDRNRPAVIILDNNNKYGHNVSPLLFGDFNEDEVRQWDQDSDQPFIMQTNHHYDQSNQAPLPQKPSIQSNTTEPVITNDKLLSPQSDLGYSSSRNTAEFCCDFSTINSVDQTMDVASDQKQSNLRCSSSCSNSAGLDQVNNNLEIGVDSNSVNSNHVQEVIVVKQPVQSGRDKMTIVCEGDLKLCYIEPTISNLDNYNHAKIVDFIGLGE